MEKKTFFLTETPDSRTYTPFDDNLSLRLLNTGLLCLSLFIKVYILCMCCSIADSFELIFAKSLYHIRLGFLLSGTCKTPIILGFWTWHII